MKNQTLVLLIGTAVTFVALDAKEPETLLDAGMSVLVALNDQLTEAESKREDLVRRYGEKHPRVMRSEYEIEHLQRLRDEKLKQMPMWARRDVANMNDDQLRRMVALLLERVVLLETRVDELSLPPRARVELLDTTP